MGDRFNTYFRISDISNYLEILLIALDIPQIVFVISQNDLEIAPILVEISDDRLKLI